MYKRKDLGVSLLFLGVCFLWEPIVGLVDCLPDIIGWLLICVGVSALADLNDDLAAAQQQFRRMLWIALARIASELLIFVFLGNTSERLNPYESAVWTLVFSFGFAVLELWLLLPAVRDFWRGLSLLSECGGARNGLATPNRKGKSFCDRMQTLTLIFLVTRAVFAVLPEMSVLTVFQTENVYTTTWFRFRTLFRIAAGLVSGGVGVAWLVSCWRFLQAFLREVAWLDSLRARYVRDVLPNTALRLGRRTDAGFAFFRIGILLSANLSMLFYEFLPDWACVLVVLCGCLILGEVLQGSSMLIGVGLSVAVVGVPRTLLNVRYLRSFVPADSLYLPEAYERYFPVCVLAAIEAVLTALFLGCLLLCVLRMEKRFSSERDSLSRLSAERGRRALHVRALLIVVFAVLSAVAKIAEAFLQPQYGWIWLLQFSLSIVVFMLFGGLLTDVSESVVGGYRIESSH